MYEPYARTVEFALIERIATALRDELGSAIEEQPALHDPDEAGQVNRAFRIVARSILKTIVSPRESLPEVLTWALQRIARRRLASAGLDEQQVRLLLRMELPARDDWTAFLILTTDDELQHLLLPEEPDQP